MAAFSASLAARLDLQHKASAADERGGRAGLVGLPDSQ
jgi:hypothetical protein